MGEEKRAGRGVELISEPSKAYLHADEERIGAVLRAEICTLWRKVAEICANGHDFGVQTQQRPGTLALQAAAGDLLGLD